MRERLQDGGVAEDPLIVLIIVNDTNNNSNDTNNNKNFNNSTNKEIVDICPVRLLRVWISEGLTQTNS